MNLILDKNNLIMAKGTSNFIYAKLNKDTNLLLGTDKSNSDVIIDLTTGERYILVDNLYNEKFSLKEISDHIDHSSIIPKYTTLKYDYSTGVESIIFNTNIELLQKDKQEENKQLFNKYLSEHPYEYNGKKYGTTLQDLLEINLMLSQSDNIEWHAVSEANESISKEDLLTIQNGIRQSVSEPYKKMQEYKVNIYNTEDPVELYNMTFIYE